VTVYPKSLRKGKKKNGGQLRRKLDRGNYGEEASYFQEGQQVRRAENGGKKKEIPRICKEKGRDQSGYKGIIKRKFFHNNETEEIEKGGTPVTK